jgi:hypothetical protein
MSLLFYLFATMSLLASAAMPIYHDNNISIAYLRLSINTDKEIQNNDCVRRSRSYKENAKEEHI